MISQACRAPIFQVYLQRRLHISSGVALLDCFFPEVFPFFCAPARAALSAEREGPPQDKTRLSIATTPSRCLRIVRQHPVDTYEYAGGLVNMLVIS